MTSVDWHKIMWSHRETFKVFEHLGTRDRIQSNPVQLSLKYLRKSLILSEVPPKCCLKHNNVNIGIRIGTNDKRQALPVLHVVDILC